MNLISRERLAHLERLTGRMLPNRDMDGAEMAIRVVDQSSLASTGKWGVALRAPAVYREAISRPGSASSWKLGQDSTGLHYRSERLLLP